MYHQRVTAPTWCGGAKYRLLWWALLGLVSGCGSTPGVPSAPVVAEPVPEVVVQQAPVRDVLKELLFAGLTALDNDHLTEPREGSAADYFGQVLDVAPDNAIALDGMRRLVARYVSLAEQAFRNGARDAAEGYLRRAEPYALPADGLDQTRLRWSSVTATKTAAENEYLLDVAALDARGEDVTWRLTEIAVKAMRAESRITIVSRSDAEGRWIYQQMREVLAEYRLRGNIVQGQVPKVILIDLPQT